jgi:FKBP-type peptidyl-prolyl cis-trans isomerase 2
MKSVILFPCCLILLLLISACNVIENEPVVELGKTITFDYAAGFDNGTLFGTTFELAARESGIYDPNIIYEPLTLVYGQDPLFPGLQESLLGMKEEEIRNVRIPPAKAYGEKIEDSITALSKTSIDNNENLRINDIITIVTPEGNRISAFVKKIGEEDITVDLNHPLAGEFIQFSIIVRSIE